MKKIVVSLAALIFILAGKSYAQGYEIEVEFKNYAEDTVILGHHFADSQLIPDDTVITNAKGKAVFKTVEKIPDGMYFMFFSNKEKFDFFLGEDRQFEISGDAQNLVRTLSVKGDQVNNDFMEYQAYRTEIWPRTQDLRTERKKADSLGNKKRVKEIDAQLKELQTEGKQKYDELLQKYPNSFMAVFLKAAQDVQVPKSITDRKKQYEYYRAHYFDNFDVSNPGLLRTPIYKKKIDTYIDKLIPQHPDSLIIQADMLIEKSRTSKELFRFMLVHLFNKYAGSQVVTSENVFVHIAEKYYISEADWSDPEFLTELKDKIARKKNCLVGNKSKEIKFQNVPRDSTKINNLLAELERLKKEGEEIEKSSVSDQQKNNKKIRGLSRFYRQFAGEETLSENLGTEFTIIWFWTPECSHCRKETPPFHEQYTDKKLKEKGVNVIAVFLNKTDINGEWQKFSETAKNWLEFIKKNELYGWQNVWSPFDPYRLNYDISSSPVLYVLDKEGKIITKRIGHKQAIKIIEKELAKK